MAIIKRKMLDTLKKWKDEETNKAFLLVGARQTGKTFIIRQFAKECFDHLAEVNFLNDKKASTVLTQAETADDLISRLSILVQVPIEPVQTLIFFDEIQEAPELITTLKFLVEDGRFSVVVSGSMLGTEMKGYRSFPVGYVQIERMFPLDFEEFCWAQNVSEHILSNIRQAYSERAGLDDPLHEKLTRMYRYFVAIGGMPEVVSAYLDSSYDMGSVRETARQIIEQYRFDITKYAEKRAPQIKAIFDAMPSQLDKPNKRFRMDALKDGAVYDRYSNDFAWLIDAAVALPVYQVSEPKNPLGRTSQINRFKLYECDTGLLIAQYSPQTMLDVIADASSINFGAVYENAVAQALSCTDPHLYYYYSSRKGEVDFLIERNDGTIVPVEVKSGKDYKLHTALNNLLGTKEYGIEEALVLSGSNVQKEMRANKPIWYMPLYMSFCLAEECNGKIEGVHLKPPTF